MWAGLYLIVSTIMIWGFTMTWPILSEKIRNIGVMAIVVGFSLITILTIAYGINLIINN